jgi:BlaI family penicillinase repressor
MARSTSTQPTDAELGILHILWSRGPCELRTICTQLRRHRSVATTTVATILGVMLNKDLAARERGPNGWLWSAKVSKKATAGKMLGKVIEHVFDGSAQLLAMHLIDGENLSPTDLRELRALLEIRNERDVRPPSKREVKK